MPFGFWNKYLFIYKYRITHYVYSVYFHNIKIKPYLQSKYLCFLASYIAHILAFQFSELTFNKVCLALMDELFKTYTATLAVVRFERKRTFRDL